MTNAEYIRSCDDTRLASLLSELKHGNDYGFDDYDLAMMDWLHADALPEMVVDLGEQRTLDTEAPGIGEFYEHFMEQGQC